MKHFYTTIFLILHAGLLFGQLSTIKGKVQLENGKPVSHVTIKVNGTNVMGISDDKGFYELRNVPFGNHKISISSLEISSQELSVPVDKAKQNLDITIDPKGNIAIEEVLVVRNSEKREIETSGFAVNVIETKQAALTNAQTNELLDRTVGVRVRQNGGLGASVQYNLNGMSGSSVGIFIDGIEISTYGSSFNLNNIPPSMIERIEVYKGVLPAHLSGDLLGGAINVILKKGATRNNFTASVSYGSFNTTQSDVSGMYRHDKTGLTVRASAFYSYSDNNYEIWGRFARQTLPNGRIEQVRTNRFNDAFKSLGGRFEIGYTDVKWADNFMIGYNGSDAYNEIQHGQFMTKPYMGRFTESQAHVFSLNYSKKDLFTEGLQFMVNGVYSDRDQYVQDTVSWNYNWYGEQTIGFNGTPLRTPTGAQQGAPTMSNINRKIVNLRSNLSYNIHENHKLTLNHVFYVVDREDMDELRTVLERSYFGTSDLSKNVLSFAYEMQAFGNRLKTNLFAKHYQQTIDRVDPYQATVDGVAVRMENITRNSRSSTGYGFALSYAVTPRVVVISSVERAVRMPSENEIFGGPAENITANPTLRPELSDNLNLGFRIGAYDFDRHRVSFSGSGFVRDTKDQIVQRSDDRLNEAIEVAPFENLGQTQAVGFEAEVNYLYNNKLNVLFSISKFNSLFKQRTDPETGALMSRYNQQLPNEPFFTMNGNVQYRLDNLVQKNAILNVYYNFGYVGRFYTIWVDAENFRTPRQFVQDVGASYMFPNKRFVVSLDAKNILNREAYDNFAVQKPGRAFYLKLNYTINNFNL